MSIFWGLGGALLTQIAGTSGGQYYLASDQTELRKIYNDLEPTLSIKPEKLELTSLLAGIGVLAFMLGGALSLLWFGRVI